MAGYLNSQGAVAQFRDLQSNLDVEQWRGAGDHTALNLKLHDGTRYPLRTLVPIAAAAGLLALAVARLRGDGGPGPGHGSPAHGPAHPAPALSG